ncbi:hypothetical protein J6590_004349 [Homalodisca vitripennis]|nr:hypothetical protein J6590_004349 [Homalodisca vitripennis]
MDNLAEDWCWYVQASASVLRTDVQVESFMADLCQQRVADEHSDCRDGGKLRANLTRMGGLTAKLSRPIKACNLTSLPSPLLLPGQASHLRGS